LPPVRRLDLRVHHEDTELLDVVRQFLLQTHGLCVVRWYGIVQFFAAPAANRENARLQLVELGEAVVAPGRGLTDP
jgi:hypothetical protein